jgi:hypothetical protein
VRRVTSTCKIVPPTLMVLSIGKKTGNNQCL